MPKNEYLKDEIDLGAALGTSSDSTVVLRVDGDAHADKGIHHDDLLIVDCSARPVFHDIVIVVRDKELKLIRLSHLDADLWLVPANAKERLRQLKKHKTLAVWGVVVWVLHPARQLRAATSEEDRIESEGR